MYKHLVNLGLIALILAGGGCAGNALQRISPTYEVDDPVQVTARFTGILHDKEAGKKISAFSFVVSTPAELTGKTILIQAFWKDIPENALTPGREYVVTVPRDIIGTGNWGCDWGMKLE